MLINKVVNININKTNKKENNNPSISSSNVNIINNKNIENLRKNKNKVNNTKNKLNISKNFDIKKINDFKINISKSLDKINKRDDLNIKENKFNYLLNNTDNKKYPLNKIENIVNEEITLIFIIKYNQRKRKRKWLMINI